MGEETAVQEQRGPLLVRQERPFVSNRTQSLAHFQHAVPHDHAKRIGEVTLETEKALLTSEDRMSEASADVH
jgi:hypothetical protein